MNARFLAGLAFTIFTLLGSTSYGQVQTRPAAYQVKVDYIKAIWPSDNGLLPNNRDEVSMQCNVYHPGGKTESRGLPGAYTTSTPPFVIKKDYFEYHTNSQDVWKSESGRGVGNILISPTISAGVTRFKYKIWDQDAGIDLIGEVDFSIIVDGAGTARFADPVPVRSCTAKTKSSSATAATYEVKCTGGESLYHLLITLKKVG